MAKPSDKSPKVEGFLEKAFGRTTAIQADKCVPPPIGCGKPVTEFKDVVSQREYAISGLCQNCQDSV